jgi:mono/diheme cytochrome c family protein
MKPLLQRIALAAPLLVCGCNDMVNQPKQTAYAPEPGPASIPADTVEYDSRPPEVPPVTIALLDRGQERYRIYCAPCHSELGDGRGVIVERGFPPPPSFELDRLRAAPPQYLFDAITRGHGVMYGFADRIVPGDRWAIVAYIRALQLSQRATPADASADERRSLP